MEDDGSLESLIWERVAHIILKEDGKFKLLADNLSDKEVKFLDRELTNYEKKKDKTGLLSPVQMIFRKMQLNKIEQVSVIYDSRGFTRFTNCLARMLKEDEM